MVAVTVLVAVLITETVSSLRFVTYILLFTESNAMPRGVSPTVMVAVTVFSAADASLIGASPMEQIIAKNVRNLILEYFIVV